MPCRRSDRSNGSDVFLQVREAVAVEQRPFLGLVFFFDNSVVGSGCQAWADLRDLADQGWIGLRRATALSDDLSHNRDPERRQRLDAEADYPKRSGLFVLNVSRLDSGAVLASTEESAVFNRIFKAVFPGTDRSLGSKTANHKTRDVMHLHTTKKHGADGFITRDNDLLRKASVLVRARATDF